VKEKRTGARPDRAGVSADFLPARPPAPRVDRRQHVTFVLGRDRQRPPRVKKIEEAIFQRAPFILVKLGMTELRLVEKRQIGRHFDDFGAGCKDVASEVHLRLAVGDRDRAGGVLFRRRARIDRIRLEMRPAIDAEYCPATGVVIGQHRVTSVAVVDLEFPGAFPDIASRECLGQTEDEYNGSNSKEPWIHRHGEPATRFREHPSASMCDDRRQDARVKHSIPLSCRLPLLALNGHQTRVSECPLLGE
jgi:hypothetical protein